MGLEISSLIAIANKGYIESRCILEGNLVILGSWGLSCNFGKSEAWSQPRPRFLCPRGYFSCP